MDIDYIKNKYVVRIGSFVGIYNVEKDKSLTLYKNLNNESYGFRHKIEYRESKEDKYGVNEYYKIPHGYNLDCKLDLMIIESCMSNNNVRLQLNAKNPKYNDKKHKYLLLSLTAYARTSEEYMLNPNCKWQMRNNGILFSSVLDAYKYYKKITKHII